MICKYLKEERKRLGYNQEGFAEIAGVSRRTYAEWEGGKTSPPAVQLAKYTAVGADVLYILTGERSGATSVLTADERQLLDRYRECPQPLKDAAQRVLQGEEVRTKATQTFHGTVLQVGGGDVINKA
ncbi:MAG: helix-turn-helix domain-containing protein [Azoarcus sp.]|jgi:transcriptional regulator with XRE-family HTH domain|nr:helix-turn-helix domain-containing protein [Azoarcus sp.]